MKTYLYFSSIILISFINTASSQQALDHYEQQNVLQAIRQIVSSDFYDVSRIPRFEHETQQSEFLTPTENPDFNHDIDVALSTLQDKHTMRFTKDQSAYYELIDIFSYAVSDKQRGRLFPDANTPNYYGIGLTAKQINGRYFISKLYDGLPAAAAGLKTGDELISLTGASSLKYPTFSPEQKLTEIKIRRHQMESAVTVKVPVMRIYPQQMFLQASLNSIKILEQDGRQIGYIRLWSGSNGEVFKSLKTHLTSGKLKDVAGLIVDLRSRWGGANPEDANLFVSNLASMKLSLRDGTVINHPPAYKKPVVAIIDHDTRSGMEIFAYNLKKNGIPLIGQPTAGALSAATGYLLPDNSFLMLAIGTVFLDGQNLDGIGVQPDIMVETYLPYANGFDDNLSIALREISFKINTQLKEN